MMFNRRYYKLKDSTGDEPLCLRRTARITPNRSTHAHIIFSGAACCGLFHVRNVKDQAVAQFDENGYKDKKSKFFSWKKTIENDWKMKKNVQKSPKIEKINFWLFRVNGSQQRGNKLFSRGFVKLFKTRFLVCYNIFK